MIEKFESLKRRSEAFIRDAGGIVNPSLPYIEAVEEVSPIPAADVARRALVLCRFAAIGHGVPVEPMKADLLQYGLWTSVTRNERALLEKDALSEQDIIDCSWRTEALQAIAWALCLAELNHLRPCDEDLPAKFPAGDPAEFITAARLRSMSELQEQADLLYRIHWCARQQQLSREAAVFSESIIRERRQAIDWIYGVESDWDEVPSDT